MLRQDRESVNLLLEAGASINFHDLANNSGISDGIDKRYCESVVYAHSSRSSRSMVTLSPLAAAVAVRNNDMIDLLLSLGADPYDNQAIFFTVSCNDEAIAELLLSTFTGRYVTNGEHRGYGIMALLHTILYENLSMVQKLAKYTDAN